MTKDVMDASMGTIWVQPSGPNTIPLLLGCHDLGDVAQPQGGITQRYCPDPSGPGKWKVASVTQGPAERVTTTITTYVKKVGDWLQKYKTCPMPVYVHQAECGRQDTFLNYDVGNLLYDGLFSSKTKTNLVMRETADASEQSFEMSFDPPLSEYWKLVVTELTTTEPAGLNDIMYCGEALCVSDCSGSVTEVCDTLWATADAVSAGATADVIYSIDAGVNWTLAAADPFAAGEDVASVVCFPIDRTTTRILVARGTTDAGNDAEIAYTDDTGANWTTVDVGSTNGEFFTLDGGALWAFDERHIWGVTDAGAIFFSEDGGASWTEQTSANATQLNMVHFADYYYGLVVGQTNTIYSTQDGGEHWAAETGPAAQAAVHALCCWVLDQNRWWVGYSDNELWYTADGGTNWTERALPDPTGAATVDSLPSMWWYNDFHGSVVVDWTDGSADDRGAILRTFDGGYDWELYAVTTAFSASGTPGMHAVLMCDENTIYTVGDLTTDNVASIVTAQPSP